MFVFFQDFTLLLLRSSSGGLKSFTSLTAQDYQICITVIEARHLAGINMDPVVCVQVSGGVGGSGVACHYIRDITWL